MKRSKLDKKGFTLAELLVVVAIIAVLAAIAIPVFGSQLKKARLAVDHAAIRDAYAIIQIANNLEEVEIDGVTKTFDQLDAESAGGGIHFLLSEDCSSLTPMFGGGASYRLQATGSTELDGEGNDYCPDCKQWDDIAGPYNPQSKMHTESLPIYIYYSKTNHRLYLGLGSGD